MALSDRIKEARLKEGLTQEQLANMIGSAKSTITGYEKGNRIPPAAVVGLIADATNVDANFLYQDEVEKHHGENISISELSIIEKYRFISEHSPDGATVVDTVLNREYSIAEKLKTQKDELKALERGIPLRLWSYYGKIACAGTGFIFDDIPTDTIEAPDANADFIIGVSGDSMEPDYHDGEKLYIKKTRHIQYGEVGIFTINNECFLKEYGTDGLVSRNSKYDNITGNESVRLIGKVIGKVEE